MTFMKINWKRRISFFNSIRSFRWPSRLRPWRTLRWGQRQPLEDAFFHPRKWLPLTSSSLQEFPYLSANYYYYSQSLNIDLKLWKNILFQAQITQATAGRKIQTRKKSSSSNSIVQTGEYQKASADR